MEAHRPPGGTPDLDAAAPVSSTPPAGHGTPPLDDIRVLAIEQFGAAPFGTMQLADMGAEVIKVEDPSVGGDVGRYVPPFQQGTDSLYFESFNRGKKSVALDLRLPQARGVLEDLVRSADAVVSNLRGDQPERLGLRYDDLKHVNARIVCVSLSGYGMTGPRAREGGYDFTIQGIAGWMHLTGGPDQPPTKTGLSLVDFCGGYVAALATLAGIARARREGVGCDADLSLFETALAQLTYIGVWAASQGFEPRRMENSAHQSVVPFQAFRTEDGWMMIACPKEDIWRRFCEAIGRTDLSADPRFADFASRDIHRAELLPILESVIASRPTETWLTTLSQAGVPSAPVNDVGTVLADPQTAARDAITEYRHPTLGVVRGPASPLRLSGGRPPLTRAPLLGEHTRDVLQDVCGYDTRQIDALQRDGVFGRD